MNRTPLALGALIFLALLTACVGHPRSNKSGQEVWTKWPKTEGDRPTKARPLYPQETVAQLFKRSDKELKAKEYESAMVTLKQINLREPWNIKAHEKYQDILLSQDKFTAAYQEFYDILQANEDQGEALWLLSRVILTKRKTTTLHTLSLNESERGKIAKLMTEANALIRERKNTDALGKLNSLVKIAPTHVAAHRMIQDLELQQAASMAVGNAEQIVVARLIERYSKLLEKHEVNGDMVYLYERVASLKMPEDESTRDSTLRYLKALALELDGYWLFYGYARAVMDRAAMSDDDGEKLALLRLSEKLYRVCTSSDELAQEGWFGLGLAQQALNNLKGARESLAFAVEVSGGGVSAELLIAHGEVLERLNANDDALKTYRRGQKLFPADIRFVYNEGRVHFVMGNKKQAIIFFERTLKQVDPEGDFAEQLRKTIKSLKE